MGDMGDFWRDIKEDRKERQEKYRAEHLPIFWRQCLEAGQLAAENDLFLKCLNQENNHYRLFLSDGWIDFWFTRTIKIKGNPAGIPDNLHMRKGPLEMVKFIIRRRSK